MFHRALCLSLLVAGHPSFSEEAREPVIRLAEPIILCVEQLGCKEFKLPPGCQLKYEGGSTLESFYVVCRGKKYKIE
jgi:hypothetical protein